MSQSTEASAQPQDPSQPAGGPQTWGSQPQPSPASEGGAAGEQRRHSHVHSRREASRAEGTQESWQDFLRQVAPQDIARRDPADPVRIAYLQSRHDEARNRRRAVTTSSAAASSSSQALSQGGTYANGAYRSSGARKRPVSLQIQNRPLPQTPNLTQEASTPDEYLVPRWQPDEEAFQCPICGRAFGMFFRRHHCRKCGRVVCAACSPHRITIPRQFIVRPPMEAESSSPPRSSASGVVDLTNDDGDALSRGDTNPALGGGQEVRLCNPCVPDPNPLPPPSYLSADGRHFLPPPRLQDSQGSRYALLPQVPHSTHPHHHVQSPSPSSRSRARQSWAGPSNPYQSPGSQQPAYVHHSRGLQTPFGSAPSGSRYSHWPLQYTPRSSDFQGYPPRTSSNAPLPPSPPPPPPPVREEDECPVCHSELPPKGPNGEETAREVHVVECIQSHFSTSTSRSERPPAEAAVAAAVAASGATPAQASASSDAADAQGAGASSSAQAVGSSRPGAGSQGRAAARRRTTGMVVYPASEKDCVGEDGVEQECVICFEEFAVGDEMGRLECLCKFHRTCIRQWWDTKGAGACPVHQDGI